MGFAQVDQVIFSDDCICRPRMFKNQAQENVDQGK